IVVIALVVVVFLAVLIALLRQTSDPALILSERVNAVANDHRAVSRNTIRRSELPAGHSDDLGSQEKSQHALHSGRRRPAEGLPLPAGVPGLTDHDRAVGVHAIGNAKATSRQKAEAGHGAVDPAEGLTSAAGVSARTDHDRAVSVHAIGTAYGRCRSRQKAEADHARRCRPAEGLRWGWGWEGGASTDHDHTVGVHAGGSATVRSRQKAEAGHGPADPRTRWFSARGTMAKPDYDPAVGAHAIGLA